MQKIKRITLTLLIVLVISAFGAFFAACGNKEVVSEISISANAKPQTTFVLGNDLDVSGGKLVVGSNEIDMTAAGVSVTGYDKTKLGEQELTVEYKGATTTFTVKVVERMVAEGYNAKYFAGDAFTASTGRMRVTNDDGTSFNVSLSDQKVSLSGTQFDAAGKKNVSATYSDGQVTYNASIPVDVYEVAAISLHKPNKNAYYSHETPIDETHKTALDLAGGYLTLTNEDKSFSKNITLTEDMVEGFDLSKANLTHLDTPQNTPLRQEITVKYAGKTAGSFFVNISYSYVSLMRDRAAEFAEAFPSWGTLPTITSEQGANAVQAMRGYFTLSDLDRELISEQEQTVVARVATVYAKQAWVDAMEDYDRTFGIGEDDEGSGYVFFNPEVSLQDAQEDYASLAASDSPVKVAGDLLFDIYGAYENMVLFAETTVKQYVEDVYSTSAFDYVLSGLEFAFELKERLESVPNTVADSAFDEYATAITSSIDVIEQSKYGGQSYGDATLYEMVSRWRGGKQDDLFELYYAYCFQTRDADRINVIKDLYLPNPEDYKLASFYGEIYLAAEILQMLASYDLMDGSYFMYVYDDILKLNETISSAEEPMIKWLYETLDFDGQTFTEYLDNLKISGYYTLSGSCLGDERFENLWAIMNDIRSDVGLTFNLDDPSSYENLDRGKIDDLLKAFVAAPASVQTEFLSSVNPYYRMTGLFVPDYALDYEGYPYTLLTQLLAIRYTRGSGALPAASQRLFLDLLFAMEDYARCYDAVPARNTPDDQQVARDASDNQQVSYFYYFRGYMADALKEYEKLSAEDKAAFDAEVGFLRTKYFDLYAQYGEDGVQQRIDLGEYETLFRDLAVATTNTMMYDSANSQGYSVYSTVIAAYQKAESIAAQILNSQNDAIIRAYYEYEYDFGEGVYMRMDYAMNQCRALYVTYLTNFGLWEQYVAADEEFNNFLVAVSDVMDLAFRGDNPVYTQADAAAVHKALTAFRAFDTEHKLLFYSLDSRSTNFYAVALGIYFRYTMGTVTGGTFTQNENCVGFAVKALALETTYLRYLANGGENASAAVRNLLKTALQQAQAAYADLKPDESEIVGEDVLNLYNDYAKIVAEIFSESKPA